GSGDAAPIGFAAVKITWLPDIERTLSGTGRRERSVAVGTFDGVHLGHREVIAGSDSVLTFDPHPVSVVAPQHTPKRLTTLERKAELIASLGVQELVVIPFDADFAMRSAGEFIDDVLACPGHGVYACVARGPASLNAAAPAAVSIGVRPTFKTGRGELIEAYLLDFDGDLYGEQLRLDFLERLRGERRFESAERLIEQMQRDVERTRELTQAH